MKDVDAYLNGLDAERRASLTRLRSLVLEAMPDAVETLQYRMPTYLYEGEVLCAFASQKHYMSLYMDPAVVERHEGELQDLSVGKSCIRFERIEELPLDTIRAMLDETVQGRKDR